MYDAAIIGAGPAGLSAVLNLKLHNKSLIWFGSKDMSIKVEKSEKIANYPGVPMVKGSDLNNAFKKQIEEMDIVLTDKMVTNITSTRKGYMILGDNDIYDAKSIILCTGASSGKGLPNEDRLLGHGVSYCATCDGFLYKGKAIAIFCGAKRYEQEIKYLSDIADKVYLYVTYNDCEIDLPNVTILQSPIVKIKGENKATGITLKNGEEIEIDGMFILRSAVAPTTLLKGLEMDGPHIMVNRQCETSKKGCFAAGDCTGRPYQIAKAVGEGNIAAHSVIEYLSKQEVKNENK